MNVLEEKTAEAVMPTIDSGSERTFRLGLTASVLVSMGAGVIGTAAIQPNLDIWYAALVRPAIDPPQWLFMPIWTVLYLMIGAAAWRVEQRAEQSALVRARVSYGIQWVLNAAWPIFFFGLKRMDLALFVLAGLWVGALVTALRFSEVDRTAGRLMVPYIAWLCFAFALNQRYVALNG